jgi:tetratricopeptide (TPR) repeat protein
MSGTMPTETMRLVRRYELLDQLGQGGMGVVYRAHDRLTGQIVALKRVTRAFDRGQAMSRPAQPGAAAETPAHLGSEEARWSISGYSLTLLNEFRTLASLRHPNIIGVHDFGFDNQGRPFYTMELLPDAETLMDAAEAAPMATKIDVLIQILRALVYLHQRGVLHRDLKPSNILLGGTAAAFQVKVLDFGLATAREQLRASPGAPGGTLAYVAPEILLGSEPSDASDLYAMGVVACELLTGHHPFIKGSPSVMSIICGAQPDLSPLPGDGALAGALARALARSPSDRYGSAREMMYALAAAVGRPVLDEPAAVRESFLQAACFVGRDAEVDTLRAALRAALRGAGAAFLVGGESGVGKSRLMEEIRCFALLHGAIAVRGQAIHSGGLSYQIWRDVLPSLCVHADLDGADVGALKPMVPGLAALIERPVPDAPELDPKAAEARLVNVLADVLARQGRPVLLILEDLQWARAESLSLLRHFIPELGRLPVLVLGSYRDDEASELPAQLPGAAMLKLRRLNRRSIAALSESILGGAGRSEEIVALLAQETEGNAFFLVEVMRALAEEAGGLEHVGRRPLPRGVLTGGARTVLDRRLNQVPEHARPLLLFAAVAGRMLDLRVLGQVEPDLPRWLHLCESVAVLEVSEGRWRFAHDKLRDALLERLDAARLCALHGEVAVAMEAAYAHDPQAHGAALAFHFRRAERFDEASRHGLAAGDSVRRLCLLPEARHHYSEALDALSHVEESPAALRRKADLLIRLVQVSIRADSAELNLLRLRSAESALIALPRPPQPEPGDRDLLPRVYHLMGSAYHYLGRPREAIDHFQLALSVQGPVPDSDMAVWSLAMIGVGLVAQGHVREAEPALSRALERLSPDREPIEWLLACGNHAGVAIGQGRGPEGAERLARCRDLARRQKDRPSVACMVAMMETLAHRWSGDWPALRASAEEALELASVEGEQVYCYIAESCVAWAEIYLGNIARAGEHRSRARQIAESLGGRLVHHDWFEAQDAMLLLVSGQPDRALDLARSRAQRSSDEGLVYSRGLAERVCGLALGRIERRAGTAIEAHFAASVRLFEEIGHHAEAAHTHLWWARLEGERGEVTAARRHGALARDAYVRYGFMYALGEAFGFS